MRRLAPNLQRFFLLAVRRPAAVIGHLPSRPAKGQSSKVRAISPCAPPEYGRNYTPAYMHIIITWVFDPNPPTRCGPRIYAHYNSWLGCKY